MKKLVSLFLALALVFSLTISASAGTYEGNVTFHSGTLNGDQKEWEATNVSTGEVSINVVDGTETATVYYVIVTWGEMEFTYNKANADQWNPEKHMYSGGTEAGWVENNNATIKVDNHSNKAVKVDAKFDDGGDYTATKNNITVTMYDGENVVNAPVTLESAAEVGSVSLEGDDVTERFNAAPTCTYTVKVDTTKVPDAADTFDVTVTISAVS